MNAVTRALTHYNPLWRIYARASLSLAKHRSLAGHPRIALRLSRLLPRYAFTEDSVLAADGAPAEVAARRRSALDALARHFDEQSPLSIAASNELRERLSDSDFVARYRVPFQFRDLIARHIHVGSVASATDGLWITDLDGNRAYDLGGSYGVNLFGTDFYKQCIDRAVEAARPLGLVLGPYHPVVADNARRLAEISRKDEVSFHMSGTEAVMQAVRLARYHSGRRHVVRFSGAYHGWWDGVQVGPGNPMPARDVLTLAEMSATTLRVLAMRDDIACVLVNPLQALTPNLAPASDGTLVSGTRSARYDKAAYRAWLVQLREVCTRKGIALVFDEVFMGFRLAKGGVQEYFGVTADLVTYGKSLGGGLPVGVLCGSRAWMRRYREEHPADICFARGTFNSHPYVMAAMNEFLRHLDTPAAAATWQDIDARWDGRAAALNARLAATGAPVRVANMTSVFTTLFSLPGRYHWMLQFYLRREQLALSWVGTGRFIFSHDYRDEDFDDVATRIVRATTAMAADGWFWRDEREGARPVGRALLRETLRALTGQRLLDAQGPSPSTPSTPAAAPPLAPTHAKSPGAAR
jgi:glutamate-1-semialdehyde 2,1-aminomutase